MRDGGVDHYGAGKFQVQGAEDFILGGFELPVNARVFLKEHCGNTQKHFPQVIDF
jgi:hypothetical protein